MKAVALLFLVALALSGHAQTRHFAAAVSSQDGRMEVFVGRSGGAGGIYHTWQSPTGWAQWRTYQPAIDSGGGIAAVRDGAGRVSVAWLSAGSIWVAGAPGPGEGLTTPRRLDTHGLVSLVAAVNLDGRVEFFGLDQGGGAWSVAQPASGEWTNLNVHSLGSLGGVALRQLAVTQYREGRLALVALDADGRASWRSQLAPNAGWNDWKPLYGNGLREIAAAANADGRLEVLALNPAGNLIHTYEVEPLPQWREWRLLTAGPFSGPIALLRNEDQRLEAFGFRENQVMHLWQHRPNSGWGDVPRTLSFGVPSQSLSATSHRDGRLVLIAGNNAGDVRYARQVAPNGGWVDWQTLPAPFSVSQPGNQAPGATPAATVQEVEWKLSALDTGFTGQIAYGGTFPTPGLVYTGTAPEQWTVLGVRNVSTVGFGLLKKNRNTSDCADSAATVYLGPNTSLSENDMMEVFGALTPRPPLTVVACGAAPKRLYVGLGVKFQQ